MKAYPNVKGTVMGFLPFKKAYHLLLAGGQLPQALHERLYSPSGMPGQARIEVAAEEIVLCDQEKSS
jgi:6-phosphogluconolactonase/glucosamine-6-phosphate isomerase/deaminase